MTEIEENVIYGYRNESGVLLFTPNLEFATIMATKYGTSKIYVEKN